MPNPMPNPMRSREILMIQVILMFPGYPDDPDDSEGSDPDYIVGLYPEPVAANGAVMANEENVANGAITANGAANEAVQAVAKSSAGTEVGAPKKRGRPPKNSKLTWGGNRRRLLLSLIFNKTILYVYKS